MGIKQLERELASLREKDRIREKKRQLQRDIREAKYGGYAKPIKNVGRGLAIAGRGVATGAGRVWEGLRRMEKEDNRRRPKKQKQVNVNDMFRW